MRLSNELTVFDTCLAGFDWLRLRQGVRESLKSELNFVESLCCRSRHGMNKHLRCCLLIDEIFKMLESQISISTQLIMMEII